MAIAFGLWQKKIDGKMYWLHTAVKTEDEAILTARNLELEYHGQVETVVVEENPEDDSFRDIMLNYPWSVYWRDK